MVALRTQLSINRYCIIYVGSKIQRKIHVINTLYTSFSSPLLQVNEQFAIDLLAEEPVVLVRGGHTWCDGGRGALGHPKVYINLDRPEIADCGYCGKRFLQEKHKELFENEQFTHKK